MTWYCTACGSHAQPTDYVTLLDQSARFARGRHCGAIRDLTTDLGEAQRAAAIHQDRLTQRRLEAQSK